MAHAYRNGLFTILMAFITIMTLLTGCMAENNDGQSTSTNSNLFTVVERETVNGTLILSLVSERDLSDLAQNSMREEAESQAFENQAYYAIRIFFYGPGETPGSDPAKCRFDWSDTQGLALSYDRSRPRNVSTEEPVTDLPEYSILDEVALISGGHYGDILIPSLSPDTPSEELALIAKGIAEVEGFDEISLYSTEDAFRANSSASYQDEHTYALKEGFLGYYKDGLFRPSTY